MIDVSFEYVHVYFSSGTDMVFLKSQDLLKTRIRPAHVCSYIGDDSFRPEAVLLGTLQGKI